MLGFVNVPRVTSTASGVALLGILLMIALTSIPPRPALAGTILAPGSFETPPVAVGGNHICVTPGDGSVVCWGDNTFGQIGKGEVTDPSQPAGDVLLQQVVIADAAANGVPECDDVTADGAVVRCREGASLDDVTAITAGFSHTCALLADSTVTCWGSNESIDGGLFSASLSGGELGDGTTVARPFPAPVIAGPGQTVALRGVRALSAAAGYTCALLEDATAKCWGNAPQATSTAPITVMADATTPLTQIAAISTGDQNACAALTDQSVVCWGTGLLGDQRSDTERDGRMPVKVTIAGSTEASLSGIQALALGHNVFNGPNGFAMGHSCALNTSAAVLCWGWNDVSQLGNGFNAVTGGFDSQRDFAVQVIAAPGSSELLRGVTAIAASGYATCALIDDGSVKCWGLDFGGESFEGAGAPVPLEVGAPSTVTRSGGIALAGFAGGSVQTAGAPIAGVVAIAGGGEAGICVVLADGGLWCSNGTGEMAQAPGVDVVAPAPIPTPTPVGTLPPTAAPGGPTAAPGEPESVVGSWDDGTLLITFADGLYTMTNVAAVTIPGSGCQVPAGTVLKTFSGTGGQYRGEELGFSPSDCTSRTTPATFTLDGDRLTVIHELTGAQTVLVRSALGPLVGEPKTFRDAIATPSEINLDPAVVIPALIFTGGLVLLVPFPSSLFNSTLEANYAEIMGGLRRARRRVREIVLAPWFWLRRSLGLTFGPAPDSRVAAEPARPDAHATPDAPTEPERDFWWTRTGIGSFILLTVLLSGYLDPSFGPNAPSVLTFLGMLIGLLVVLAVFDLPVARFNRRHRIGSWKHALPATVAVSIACVLISRLTDFQPGYLYGLVIATFTIGKRDIPTEGKVMTVAVASSMAAAVAAWFGLGIVGPMAAASSDPGPLLIVAQTALSMIVVAGVELASFGMLPISVLVGKGIFTWSKPVWLALTAFGWLAFLLVILNPQNGYLADPAHTPIYTVVGLLAFFGIGSVLFWLYFRRRHSARQAASA